VPVISPEVDVQKSRFLDCAELPLDGNSAPLEMTILEGQKRNASSRHRHFG
jgi:hypothetical protein